MVRMKILQIYKDFYPPVVGGIEKHLNLLSRKIQRCGAEVEILVSNTCSNLEVIDFNGIRVTKIPQWGRLLSAPLNPGVAYWIRKLGKSNDILHFHLPNPTAVMGYLASGLKKHVVVTYHSDIVRQRKVRKVFTPFLRYFLKYDTKKIIATSENIKRNSNILKSYPEKTDVIPLGIDIDNYLGKKNHENIARIKAKFGDRLVLFIGKFRYYKGLNILIEAMRNTNAILMVIGRGPMECEIKEKVNEYGLQKKIVFMSEVPDNFLIDCIHACELLVLPSVFKSEAFGIVLLEAMICGKPVISTNLGTGTSFVNIHNHTGLVVPPNNPYELEKALKYILNNHVEKISLGRNAKKRVIEHFSADLMAARTMALYSSLMR